jgi:prohead serine protease
MLTAQLPLMYRASEFAPQSYSEQNNTVDVVWTTGATVRRVNYTFDGAQEFDEELVVGSNSVRLDRLNAGAPLLDTHGKWSLASVIGSVVPGSARLDRGKGLATVQLSRAAGDADTVQKIRDGVIRNISAGYRIHGVERIEKDGNVPLVRVVDWEPWEISAVPVPADQGAQFRAATDQPLFPCAIAGAEVAQFHHARRMRMRQRQLLA